jgi:hypothetical protein
MPTAPPTPALSPAEVQEFQAALAAAQAEDLGEQADAAAQVAWTERILGELHQGWLIHGDEWRCIRPDGATPLAATVPVARKRQWGKHLAIAVASLGLLGGVWWAITPSAPHAGARTAAVPLKGTPGAPTGTPLAPPTVAAGFSTGQGVPAAPIHPNNLDLGGRSFGVYQAPVQQNRWQVSYGPGVANWPPGAHLNWSFAIYLTADHDAGTPAWLDSLQTGTTEATVRVVERDRTIHNIRFRLIARSRIPRTATEVFNPTWPGLTVAIHDGRGETWLLLRGTEILDDPRTPDDAAVPVPEGGDRQ